MTLSHDFLFCGSSLLLLVQFLTGKSKDVVFAVSLFHLLPYIMAFISMKFSYMSIINALCVISEISRISLMLPYFCLFLKYLGIVTTFPNLSAS